MPLYPVVSSLATLEPGEGGGGSAEGSFVVAVRACGLVSPARRPLRPGERSALVVGGTSRHARPHDLRRTDCVPYCLTPQPADRPARAPRRRTG